MLVSLAYALNSLRWTFPAVIMIAPSPFIFPVIQAMLLLKPILPGNVYETLDETVWSSFQRMILFFFGNYAGTEITFYGDYEEYINSNDSAIIISNHQTAVDWIVMDMLAIRQGALGKMRFVLKDTLKYIPLFGLYFWQHNCVNVGRFGGFKESKSIKQLKYLKDHKIPTWLVIFPEGTRYNPQNIKAIENSRKYGQKNGLPVLYNVLAPRLKATQLALQHLQPHVTTIYNFTVAYESSRNVTKKAVSRLTAPGMPTFVTNLSNRLHIHIEKIDAKDIPLEAEEMKSWMYSLFQEKDKMMERFLVTGRLADKMVCCESATKWSQTLPAALFFTIVTVPLLAHPVGRTAYATVVVGGSIASMLFMAVN